MPHEAWSRRAVLGAMAASSLIGPDAWALGAASQVDIAELAIPGASIHRAAAWQRLLFELIQTTSVEANPETVQIAPEDPNLFAHPFTVLIGRDALPPMSDDGVEQLRRYVSYGGFLFFDDASGSRDGPFAQSVRALCRQLFPTRPMTPLPGDHSLYRAFFLLERPVGRVAVSEVLEGVTRGPVTPIVYCPNDLSGALHRGEDGRDRFPVVPNGELQRREAVKLGVNLVMYSLTSNYKHDQAHVLELMRDGKLE